jgi:hypothetical protein
MPNAANMSRDESHSSPSSCSHPDFEWISFLGERRFGHHSGIDHCTIFIFAQAFWTFPHETNPCLFGRATGWKLRVFGHTWAKL